VAQSLHILGMQAYFNDIFRLVAAVLLMGNILFDDTALDNENGCVVKELGPLIELMGLDAEKLKTVFTMK
jgi:myosin heavy subunit